MNQKVDALLKPIQLTDNNAVDGGFMNKSLPYWQGRAFAEIAFARDVTERLGNEYEELVIKAAKLARDEFDRDGYVSKENVAEIERLLAPVAPLCKEFIVHCIGHAHIDMNWQWGYDETVNIVLSNLGTTVELMKEYPFMTFAQSQGAVYEIIEKYGSKKLLQDIKALVKDGRWEVTGGCWSENDKNMPNGESLVRQFLYTKKYVSNLLDMNPDDICVSFEPDTFGHNQNMPQILTKCGMKYMYHNRGDKTCPYFVKWQAPSGEKILTYKDTRWYSNRVEAVMMERALLAYDCSGQKNLLYIYGTGDHGGGPTRRDVNRLLDMQTWPIYPTIIPSTFRAFFEAVEANETKIVDESGEKNPFSAGCYTTQTRIKYANRTAERVFDSGEKFSAIDMLYGNEYPTEKYEKAWKKILFNQFHDILPGSNVKESREFAMGDFQKAMSYANTERSYALRNIADRIDTSKFIKEDDYLDDTACSAGSGKIGTMYGNYSGCSASGKNRIYTFFNPADHDRDETAEFFIWDWKLTEGWQVLDENGKVIPFTIVDGGFNSYWGHYFAKALVKIKVPAMGYSCINLTKSDMTVSRLPELGAISYREDSTDNFVLENDLVRVELDTVTAEIISFYDKRQKKEFCNSSVKGAGAFRLINEATNKGMAAWRVGRYMDIEPLTKNLTVRYIENFMMRKTISVEGDFSNSHISYKISLDKDSPALKYTCTCDWYEKGTRETGVPQLNFLFPLEFPVDKYIYNVPFGVIERDEIDLDQVGNSFIYGVDKEDENGSGMMLFSDCKYGFRGYNNSVSVDLIRSAFTPDPDPEYGKIEFTLALVPFESKSAKTLVDAAYDLNNPMLSVCQNPREGSMPMTCSFIKAEGDVSISSVKADEKTGKDIIVRLYNPTDKDSDAKLVCFKNVKEALYCSPLEIKTAKKAECSGNEISVLVKANSFESIIVKF